jgi:hypothetical protein
MRTEENHDDATACPRLRYGSDSCRSGPHRFRSGARRHADKVIKIGALLPMSGPGSAYFGAQDK